jgi:hypothetical protein
MRSFNEWLAIAPNAQPACAMVGALVSVNDFCGRESRVLSPHDVLKTGKYCFRYYPTPQLPHGWDAGVLFEEIQRTLFCSDLFHQGNDVEPLTTSDIIERCRATLTEFQATPLANYVPYTPIRKSFSKVWPRLHQLLWLVCTVPASRAIAMKLCLTSQP